MRDDDTTDGTWLPTDALGRFAARLSALPLPPEPDWSAVRTTPSHRFALRPWSQAMAIAATLLVLLAAGGLWTSGWRVDAIEGRPGFRGLAWLGRLGPGGTLVTGVRTRARLEVPGMGHVTLGPGSCVRRAAGRAGERRLELERGTLEARISAPPRLFVVGTSVGSAVDLGCRYTLTVDSTDHGRLEVAEGRVVFEQEGLVSRVPAGLWCPLGPNGAGAPRRAYASDSFLAALVPTDTPGCRSGELEAALGQAEASDAITLWHLLPRVSQEERRAVADRIAQLIPVPPAVARERVLALDPAALEAWWDALGMGSAEAWRTEGPRQDPR